MSSCDLKSLRRCDTISSFSALPPNSIIIELMDNTLSVPIELHSFLLDNKIIEEDDIGDGDDLPPPRRSEGSISIDELPVPPPVSPPKPPQQKDELTQKKRTR